MKKFSEIIMNEEFLGFTRTKQHESDTKWVKISKLLLDDYIKHLVSGEKTQIHSKEKEMYDFDSYKVKSIENVDSTKFIVKIETYNVIGKKLNEIEYHVTI